MNPEFLLGNLNFKKFVSPCIVVAVKVWVNLNIKMFRFLNFFHLISAALPTP